MTNSPESARVLRWVFRRGKQAITCEIDATRGGGCEVCLVPHWNVSASLVESFHTVHEGFQRHAEVARRLRETGWSRAGAPGTAFQIRTAA